MSVSRFELIPADSPTTSTRGSDFWLHDDMLYGRTRRHAPHGELGDAVDLIDNVDSLVETTSRWFLNNPAGQQPIDETISMFGADYAALTETIGASGAAAWNESRLAGTDRLIAQGVPPAIAKSHAYIEDLVHAPDIIELARQTGRSVTEVSGVFFRLGRAVRIDWLEQQRDRASRSFFPLIPQA